MMSVLFRLFVFLLLPSEIFAGGVFWTDRGANLLRRMSFDGSGLETIQLSGVVASPGTNTRGLALDLDGGRIFWADNGANEIRRANFDGSGTVILSSVETSSFPADVHVDSKAGRVYWCDRDQRHLYQSDFDGTEVTTAVSDAALSGPYFMDLDPREGKLYWGDFSGGRIYRSNLDGEQREILLTGNNSTRGVRVDPVGRILYWVNRNARKIHRAPLSAFANGFITVDHPAVETVYSGLDTPHGLAIDVPARKLYWADTGTNPGPGEGGKAVSRGDLDGASPMEIIATGNQPWDVEVDPHCHSYDEWKRRCFRRDAPESDTDPEADPDGDLFGNVLEYCFDLSPLHADVRNGPKVSLVEGDAPGSMYPAIRYRRRSGTSDLGIYVQISSNLNEWTGDQAVSVVEEIEVSPLGGGMEMVLARALQPVGGAATRYMRVVVVLDR